MKKILISTLAATTVLLTQVQAEDHQKDSIKVEKSFKNSFDRDQLKHAFIDAAVQGSWTLKNENSESLTFEKSFSQKSKYYNHAAYRGQRKIIHETVTLQVNISPNEFLMDLNVKDKNSRIAQEAQESMKELQNAVYANLVAETL